MGGAVGFYRRKTCIHVAMLYVVVHIMDYYAIYQMSQYCMYACIHAAYPYIQNLENDPSHKNQFQI